jgi:hypothetical protein
LVYPAFGTKTLKQGLSFAFVNENTGTCMVFAICVSDDEIEREKWRWLISQWRV